MRKFILTAVLAILPFGLSAARLTLRDGTVVNGQFVSGNSQTIVFQDDNGVQRRFDVSQIQLLDFTPVASSRNGGYPASPGNYPQQQTQQANLPPVQYPPPGEANRLDERRYEHDWTVLPA
ncbi:MAG TPA: hypothetical protein VGH38_11980, partial [Bryobacteraceae bacterium]